MIFSVISIVLNDLEGLQRTYESVRKQGCRDFEWLVIDGGSDDGSVDWLSGQDASWLKWWSGPDEGLYDAMNKGIDRSEGDYLVFLNAGDEFAHDEALELVRAEIESDADPHFVYGDAVDVVPESGQTYSRKARSHEAIWFTMFACHQAMFFERARMGDLRYRLEFRNAGDYQLVAEFLSPSHEQGPARVSRVDGPLCRFWLGGNSTQHRLKTLREDFEIRERFIGVKKPTNLMLFGAHRVHTWLKRNFFGLTRLLRR